VSSLLFTKFSKSCPALAPASLGANLSEDMAAGEAAGLGPGLSPQVSLIGLHIENEPTNKNLLVG